jgi:2'-5' RNA ligase
MAKNDRIKRVFVALPFTGGIRKNLSQAQQILRDRLDGWRWTRPDQMHITLKFIGELPVDMVAELCALVADSVADVAPFEFRLEGLGRFPVRGSNPRVLWAGCGGNVEPLITIAQQIDAACAEVLAVPPETKGFRPHVTLARSTKRTTSESAEQLDAEIDAWSGRELAKVTAKRVIIYESTLAPDGASYTALAVSDLVPGDG